jgi:hypothetical protein
MMAACVESLGQAPLDTAPGTTSTARDDDELRWVLPSEIDCFGRPAPLLPFTVRLRRALAPRSLLALAEGLSLWLL